MFLPQEAILSTSKPGKSTKKRSSAGHKNTRTAGYTQLNSGYANYLALLNAEQTYQQAAINLVQAQANRYADTAALFLALGGGWWNRPANMAN